MGGLKLFLYGLLYGLLLSLVVTGVLLAVARRPPGHPVLIAERPTPLPVRIHVTGAVAAPGVYGLPRGAIVQDALAAAGGPLQSADLGRLNLAQLLVDGDQVIVPETPPTPTPRPPTPTRAPTQTVGPGTPSPTPAPTETAVPAPAAGASGSVIVNINTATLAELEALPRIGPSIAQRIIDYRNANGPFNSIEEIMNVKGVGPATFEQIKDFITVN